MLWSSIPAAIPVDSVTVKEDDWTLSPEQAANCIGPKLYTKVADNNRNFPQQCCVWVLFQPAEIYLLIFFLQPANFFNDFLFRLAIFFTDFFSGVFSLKSKYLQVKQGDLQYYYHNLNKNINHYIPLVMLGYTAKRLKLLYKF